MERSKRNWALRLAVGLVVVAGAFLASMSGFAEREGVSFTATLYSDVIRFEADGVASLRVTVYDLAENELWSSGQVMGDFVDWDRANERGERLANGYYLYLAQGWDGSDALILNKAGKVVLLPGDQVELRAAPTTGGITFENPDITFGTKAVGETAYYSYIDLSGVNYPQYIMLSDLGGAHQWSFFGSSAGFYIRDRTVARNPFAILNSAPNNALVLDGSGYLKLSQSNYPQYIMKSNLGGAHEWSFFGADTGYYIRDRTAGLNSFGIQNSAPANSLIIQSDGNVGIGTTNPQTRLDVDGTGRFTGALAVGAYVLPATDGTAGQVLTTNGTGIASWQTVSGGGSGWSLTGNAGTTPGTNFIGTTDNQSLVMKVNNSQVMRIDNSVPANGPSIAFGDPANSVGGTYGATISGGGTSAHSNRVWDNFGTISGGAFNRAGSNDGNAATQVYPTVGGGYDNDVLAGYATVSGGYDNDIHDLSKYAAIGGGQTNYVGTDSDWAFIGGGLENIITGASQKCFIGSGHGNEIDGASHWAAIAGGQDNTLDEAATCSFIGGGWGNEINGASSYAVIASGRDNEINDDSGTAADNAVISGGRENVVENAYGTIAGGYSNIASGSASFVAGWNNEASGAKAVAVGGLNNVASGNQSAVLGGWSNEASGDFSVALGYNSHATHDGSFVFSDSDAAEVASPCANSMKCVFEEGFDFRTRSGEYLRLLYYGTERISCDNGAYLSAGGDWTNASDVALKQGFEPIDSVAILESVAELPISSWSYKSEDESVIHIGPVAQDFHAAFGLGHDDTSISTVDADGVSLAAIQALYELVQQQQAQIDALEERIADLEAVDGE